MRLGKFSRDPAHRNSLFRTLVSQLIQYEQIRTTLPKAKATARMAERVITWAKRSTIGSQRKAEGYIRPWLRLRGHLFDVLAKRYEGREGGYTRVHRLGHQRTNQAPVGIVEFVDSPNDLKRTMVARTIARQLAEQELGLNPPGIKLSAPSEVWQAANLAIAKDDDAARGVIEGFADRLHPVTRDGLEKVLSGAYVSAWDYCRPRGPLPTLEKAQRMNEERKRRQASEEWQRGRPSGGAGPPPIVYKEGSNPPAGPYTAFLSMVSKQFLNQVALLSATSNSKSLVSRQLSEDDRTWLPKSGDAEAGPGERASIIKKAMAAQAGNFNYGSTAKAARRRKSEKPAHLRALKLPSLRPQAQSVA